MRISGRRTDGALLVSLGGGVAVILKGGYVTQPLDDLVVDAMGPWEPADNTYEDRLRVEQVLNNASLATREFFLLGGQGSGNFGHSGRPGQEGGSGGGGDSKGGKYSAPTSAHPREASGGFAKGKDTVFKETPKYSIPEDKGEDKEARTIEHLEKVDTHGMSKSERKAHDQSISDAKWRRSQFEHAGRAAGPATATGENRWAEPEDTGYSTKERAAYRTTLEGRPGKDWGEDKPDPGAWVKDRGIVGERTTLEHKKNPQSGNFTHKGRAAGRLSDDNHGGSMLDGFAKDVIHAAKAAAQWKQSPDSTTMQRNIARNAVYREAVEQMSVRMMRPGYVTDDDLLTFADAMTPKDLIFLAAAFGMKGGGGGGGEKKGGGGGSEPSEFGEPDDSHLREGDNEPEGAVALDKYHSLDEDEDKKKEPVSEIAKATQEGEAKQPITVPGPEVMNLPPAAAVALDPAEDKKKRRQALREKIRAAARSKGRTADTLESEEISDDDLFAMAKELGVTIEEAPSVVALVDNETRFSRLLASTNIAKHLAAGGEHPFTYCMENVVPAMEREGKAPDDPEAFCAYWKAEHA